MRRARLGLFFSQVAMSRNTFAASGRMETVALSKYIGPPGTESMSTLVVRCVVEAVPLGVNAPGETEGALTEGVEAGGAEAGGCGGMLVAPLASGCFGAAAGGGVGCDSGATDAGAVG